LPAAEEIADRADRANAVVPALIVPAADASIEDRVREREEELDVGFDPRLGRPVVVAVRDILGEEVPVA
jgi:hypothetical protein